MCDSEVVVQPNSTADVAAAMKALGAQADASGKALKVRATRRKFHSSAAFTCPDQNGGLQRLASPKTVLGAAILHEGLNKALGYDAKAHVLRVGAGMNLTELLKAATDVGASVQVGTLPAYQGLTLAGIFATSAHGSGDLTKGMLVSCVV